MGHARFHHTIQNGAQFQLYGLFISGIFHVTFQIVGTETTKSETADKGETIVHVVPILLGETVKAEGTSRVL